MSEQLEIRRRRAKGRPMRTRRTSALHAATAGGPAVAFPGINYLDEEDSRRTWISGSVAFLLHAGVVVGLEEHTLRLEHTSDIHVDRMLLPHDKVEAAASPPTPPLPVASPKATPKFYWLASSP